MGRGQGGTRGAGLVTSAPGGGMVVQTPLPASTYSTGTRITAAREARQLLSRAREAAASAQARIDRGTASAADRRIVGAARDITTSVVPVRRRWVARPGEPIQRVRSPQEYAVAVRFAPRGRGPTTARRPLGAREVLGAGAARRAEARMRSDMLRIITPRGIGARRVTPAGREGGVVGGRQTYILTGARRRG